MHAFVQILQNYLSYVVFFPVKQHLYNLDSKHLLQGLCDVTGVLLHKLL